jgi:hypothetical protein
MEHWYYSTTLFFQIHCKRTQDKIFPNSLVEFEWHAFEGWSFYFACSMFVSNFFFLAHSKFVPNSFATTKCISIHQVLSLDFEWIHWSHWTRTSGDLMNSLVHWTGSSEFHPHFVIVFLLRSF